MNDFFNQNLSKLEIEINDLENEHNCLIERVEKTIHLIVDCLSEMKKYVIKKEFKTVDDEILFFKHQKRPLSKVILMIEVASFIPSHLRLRHLPYRFVPMASRYLYDQNVHTPLSDDKSDDVNLTFL